MSIYHMDISNVSRAVNGNAVSSLAYISGEEVEEEKTGEIKKYKREDKVLAKKNIVPEDSPARYKESAANWANDLEKIETADNARTAKRIRMALPEEMTMEQQQQAIEAWIKENCTQHGYPATYAIHAGKVSVSESGTHQNRHVHILVGNRPLENGQWAKVKNKKVYKLDEYGERVPKLATDEDGKPIPIRGEDGEQLKDKHGRPIWKQLEKTGKDGRTRKQWARVTVSQNRLDKMSTLKDMRASWSRICNQYLEPEYWIDHRSYRDRGLMIAPTIHEGYEARGIERKGGVSWRCEKNREAKALNHDYQKALLQENALEGTLEKVQGKLSAFKGAAGKAVGAIGTAAGAVKGAVSQGVGAILGKADGRGMQGVMEDTAGEVIKSLVKGNIVGAGLAVAQMPLAVLKNVESEDVKRDRMKEEQEKADAENFIPGGKRKKKKKEQSQSQQGRAGGRVRSNHEQPPEQRGGGGR